MRSKNGKLSAATTSRCGLTATPKESRRSHKTIFYDRSLRLFTLDFGTSDSGREIQHEIGTRLLVSLTLAGPMLLLTA